MMASGHRRDRARGAAGEQSYGAAGDRARGEADETAGEQAYGEADERARGEADETAGESTRRQARDAAEEQAGDRADERAGAFEPQSQPTSAPEPASAATAASAPTPSLVDAAFTSDAIPDVAASFAASSTNGREPQLAPPADPGLGSRHASAAKRTSKRSGRLGAILPYLVIVVGLAVLMWPVVSAWWEAWQASQAISEVTSTYDEMSDPERAELRAEARHYNEVLAADGDLTLLPPYSEQLAFRGSEMIAYISIPKCSVRLPIYHGTEDKVLMAGVGHLRGTSLPVGGESSHCVLTAHTGMPGRVMFDDIRLLEEGDEFVVWVLGEPLAYRVTGSEVVEPTDVSSLGIQAGRDLCTLVTCTPYGVNSHRLLVHAERCEYVPGAEDMPSAAVYVNDRTLPLLVASGVVALLALGLVVRRRRRTRRRELSDDSRDEG